MNENLYFCNETVASFIRRGSTGHHPPQYYLIIMYKIYSISAKLVCYSENVAKKFIICILIISQNFGQHTNRFSDLIDESLKLLNKSPRRFEECLNHFNVIIIKKWLLKCLIKKFKISLYLLYCDKRMLSLIVKFNFVR